MGHLATLEGHRSSDKPSSGPSSSLLGPLGPGSALKELPQRRVNRRRAPAAARGPCRCSCQGAQTPESCLTQSAGQDGVLEGMQDTSRGTDEGEPDGEAGERRIRQREVHGELRTEIHHLSVLQMKSKTEVSSRVVTASEPCQGTYCLFQLLAAPGSPWLRGSIAAVFTPSPLCACLSFCPGFLLYNNTPPMTLSNAVLSSRLMATTAKAESSGRPNCISPWCL